MEPYLSEYVVLPVRAIESMLAMKSIIISAHKDKREGEIRIAALEEALRQAKIREAADRQRLLNKERERREKRRKRLPNI